MASFFLVIRPFRLAAQWGIVVKWTLVQARHPFSPLSGRLSRLLCHLSEYDELTALHVQCQGTLIIDQI